MSSIDIVKMSFFEEPSSRFKVLTAEMHGIENKLKVRKDREVRTPFAVLVERKENGEVAERILFPPPAMTEREDTTCSFAIRPCKAETVSPQE